MIEFHQLLMFVLGLGLTHPAELVFYPSLGVTTINIPSEIKVFYGCVACFGFSCSPATLVGLSESLSDR